MRHIPVDRKQGEAAYARALDSLRSGEIIGVFPEATISQSFALKSFKSGAARHGPGGGGPADPDGRLGHQAAVDQGAPANFTRSHIPITIRVGEVIEASKDKYAGAITRQLRERVQELLEAAQRAYPVHPNGPDDTWWMPAHLGGTAPTPEQVRESEARRPARNGAGFTDLRMPNTPWVPVGERGTDEARAVVARDRSVPGSVPPARASEFRGSVRQRCGRSGASLSASSTAGCGAAWRTG